MKLGLVTKRDTGNKTMSKRFDDDVMLEILTLCSFLQKMKTELKNLLHNSRTVPLNKGTILAKKR